MGKCQVIACTPQNGVCSMHTTGVTNQTYILELVQLLLDSSSMAKDNVTQRRLGIFIVPGKIS